MSEWTISVCVNLCWALVAGGVTMHRDLARYLTILAVVRVLVSAVQPDVPSERHRHRRHHAPSPVEPRHVSDRRPLRPVTTSRPASPSRHPAQSPVRSSPRPAWPRSARGDPDPHPQPAQSHPALSDLDLDSPSRPTAGRVPGRGRGANGGAGADSGGGRALGPWMLSASRPSTPRHLTNPRDCNFCTTCMTHGLRSAWCNKHGSAQRFQPDLKACQATNFSMKTAWASWVEELPSSYATRSRTTDSRNSKSSTLNLS